MKKILILMLVMITLIGCGSNNEVMSNSNTDVKTTELQSNEQTSIEDEAIKVLLKDEKKSDNKPLHDVKNALSFIPIDYSYNDAGELVVSGYIHNDLEYQTSTVRVRDLEIYNEDDKLIASNTFGYLNHYDITRFEPDESFEITYTFPAMDVYIKDDDLDTITTVFKTSSYVYYD